MAAMMQASVCTRYGPPEVLAVRAVPKPFPKADEVLVRVRAATVTAADNSLLAADPFIARLYLGLIRPRCEILGAVFAGEVEAVGSEVHRFEPGDRVFGLSPNDFGAHAEYKCLSQSGVLAKAPRGLSFEQAASLAEATTALTFLRDIAPIQRGQRVLINGASGSVGSFGVQLANYFGADVTGVCSGANRSLVESLGADTVLDYTKHDFTERGDHYDVIFDAVGKSSFARCEQSLTPRGVYLSGDPTPGLLIRHLWTSRSKGKKARFAATGLKQTSENLDYLSELVDAGRLTAVIDRCYPLQQIAQAYRYAGKGHKKGSVVVTV